MPIKKSFSEVALSKESLTSRRSDKLAFRQGSVRQTSDKRRLMGWPGLPSKGYKYMMTMQLIVLYILWRFTKAILMGWSKDSHYRDRWTGLFWCLFLVSPFWLLGDSYCRVYAFVAQMLKMKSFLQNPFRVLFLPFLCSIYFRISIKY